MIKVKDLIPNITLHLMSNDGPEPHKTHYLFGTGRHVLFGLPGAFTPTCSGKHVPGFVKHADAIKQKNITSINCISVNDIFVMDAWGKDQHVGNHVTMIADGSALFTKEADLVLDLTSNGFGLRSTRYAMVINNNYVEHLFVEEGGQFKVSSAEYILNHL